ncbi:hypothetical protein Daura_30085 [Dactylosporangium aurantiacum]|uniref:Uncharacterized protein n=1 Tax=Dactylosporangium aurantiacum TaxID=35754 RepID=A0A9Q9I8C2_9ACTN|nr:hypothetical protein [Dactylosporangium aurantiacum]MDG6106885.1 hypothetical protein [Dactylosporangium aurantiacum]UWZ51016.1 hypothetical protein Daura_30085 [Dactylosporangium aurantiacum]
MTTPALLPSLDDAALCHATQLLDELRGTVRAARCGGGAGRAERIEEALAQARALSATLRTALISARDRPVVPPD